MENVSDSIITKDEFVSAFNFQFINNPHATDVYDKYYQIIKQGLIGISTEMQGVFYKIQLYSDKELPVFIYGETGTGKELVARALHHLDPNRRDKPFVAINCAGIPEEILTSELFGYKKGAFTGAKEDKEGLFDRAAGGVIFFDELADMPLSLQAKILRATNTGDTNPTKIKYYPVGSTTEHQVDIRIIAAAQRINEGKNKLIRDDLLARLCRLDITLPNLSQRRSDLPILVYYFIKQYNAYFSKKPITHITKEFLLSLYGDIVYDEEYKINEILPRDKFQGNIRGLRNYIQDGCTFADEIENKKIVWFNSHELPPEDYSSPEHRSIVEPMLLENIRNSNLIPIQEICSYRDFQLREMLKEASVWDNNMPPRAKAIIAIYHEYIGWEFELWQREYWRSLRSKYPDINLSKLEKISGKDAGTVQAKLEEYLSEKFGKKKIKDG